MNCVGCLSQQEPPHLAAALPLAYLSQECTPMCCRTAISMDLWAPFLISIISL